MSRIQQLIDRLEEGQTILLDGAMASELQKRGVKTTIPLWSASSLMTAPQVVQQIHFDYIKAGADIITANTFRTGYHTLNKVAQGGRAEELTNLAVQLAQRARAESGRDEVLIAGSIAPLEDSLTPSIVPERDVVRLDQRRHIRNVANTEVDFIMAETMNNLLEASIVAEELAETGVPFTINFCCDEQGNLLSGHSLDDAIDAVMPYGPFAIFTNCRPLAYIGISLQRLLDRGVPYVGIYANGNGAPEGDQGWTFLDNTREEEYLMHAQKWLDQGASIIGGCCGTSPEHIHLLKTMIELNK